MKSALPWLQLLSALVLVSTAASTSASSPTSASTPTSTSTAASTASNSPASSNDLPERIAACSACHGKQGRAASDGYYPRIAGKPAGYLFNQLQNFRQGRRQYPLMTYMVQHLSDAYLQEIAAYYADQHLPYPPAQSSQVSQSILQRGQTLVQKGDAARQIPACVACHGQQLTGVAPAIPGLLGLPTDYLSAQFGAWKRGARRAAEPDCMAQITERLTLEEIQAASAWLAQQTPPADARPAAAGSLKLPIACGSVKEQP